MFAVSGHAMHWHCAPLALCAIGIVRHLLERDFKMRLGSPDKKRKSTNFKLRLGSPDKSATENSPDNAHWSEIFASPKIKKTNNNLLNKKNVGGTTWESPGKKYLNSSLISTCVCVFILCSSFVVQALSEWLSPRKNVRKKLRKSINFEMKRFDSKTAALSLDSIASPKAKGNGAIESGSVFDIDNR